MYVATTPLPFQFSRGRRRAHCAVFAASPWWANSHLSKAACKRGSWRGRLGGNPLVQLAAVEPVRALPKSQLYVAVWHGLQHVATLLASMTTEHAVHLCPHSPAAVQGLPVAACLPPVAGPSDACLISTLIREKK